MSKVASHFGDRTVDDVQHQIHRYFLAVHGESYMYRAPESFENVLERWMWAVLHDDPSFADAQMLKIEQKMRELAHDQGGAAT